MSRALPITVETRENLNPLPLDPEQMKRIDWRDSSDRKWLINHLTWAFHNNRAVELIPESN